MPEALSLQYCNLSRENDLKAAILHNRAGIGERNMTGLNQETQMCVRVYLCSLSVCMCACERERRGPGWGGGRGEVKSEIGMSQNHSHYLSYETKKL